MLTKMLLDTHYRDKAALCMAIADVLAEQVKHIDAAVVQVDEANLPGAPHEWEWAAEAINRVLRAVRTTPAVHLCFGNYGGQSVQKGSWGQLMNYLNALHVDHIVMENAHRPAEELAVFRELRPEIGFGLGVVDIKRTEVESADAIARAIEHADKVLGRGPREIHPSRLRLLDAQARHRGREDQGAGEGQGPLRGTALSAAVTSRYNGADKVAALTLSHAENTAAGQAGRPQLAPRRRARRARFCWSFSLSCSGRC